MKMIIDLKNNIKNRLNDTEGAKLKSTKGFTLAELLIVVAIIGVLVAISIPIFTSQLEKSRDAASVANIRSAYAEAQAAYLSGDTTKSGWYEGKHHMWINYNRSLGYVNAIDVVVQIKSKKQNNWSGMGNNLPDALKGVKDNKTSGKYLLAINYDSDGNITSASLTEIISAWKDLPDLN